MKRWLAGLALAAVLALALAAAGCRQEVPLGVTASVDAAVADAADGGAGE